MCETRWKGKTTLMGRKDYHPNGHLRTGQLNCNKCGRELTGEEDFSDCWFCGPVCNDCSYSCFEENKHCRSR